MVAISHKIDFLSNIFYFFLTFYQKALALASNKSNYKIFMPMEKQKCKLPLYVGKFDTFNRGHGSVLTRLLRNSERVIIGVENISSDYAFSFEDRITMDSNNFYNARILFETFNNLFAVLTGSTS